ncbi:hypothetical protein KW784_00100 [Candidatus Parcubacteria bacterium]|nr:hypothetical protein [Candidatus Parcubacteria bacterium]
MKSTSIHSLNADTGLNPTAKAAYLFLNFLNNLFPYRHVDFRIEIRSFSDKNWKSELGNTYESSSVGRRLSDIFWRTLPWEKIKEELGEIRAFDTGCGQGNYGTRLLAASGGRLASYVGIDAKRRENWKRLESEHPNFRFIESRSTDVSALIPPGTNLFVTQSAIEHFDRDINFFEQIRDYIARSEGPVIQIHNFPARAVLPLYLFHGIRQYTPRTISKITTLFPDAGIFLYGLGGREAKRVQWKYFTWPLLILRRKARWSEDVKAYDAEVAKAIESDMGRPGKHPLFWVLIIHSRPRHKIW